ncbi:unnamed protein product [Oppiella nova]|uniref:Uncharacterized protein n=1 Tax=Oppiella nova TaxID=334625 RepID=A0A7R9LFT0_9ACAR|nr:unnamed protein product [Oppiella nova]CAG2162468.1 unnamed protein product [Oppiella nova]
MLTRLSSYTKAYYKLKSNLKKNITIESLNKFERYFQSPSIAVLSFNFEEYAKNKDIDCVIRKRQIVGIGVCIFGWLTVLKFFVAAFVRSSTLWPLIGDPFYLTGDRILFNLVIASIALNASAMRTAFLIVCAVLRQDYNYTISVSIIWFVWTSLAAWVAASMQGYYLTLRFRQVGKRIVYSLSKNKYILMNLLREHNSIVKLTDEYNKFFNHIIAINYFAATVAINFLLYITFFGNGNVLFRIGNGLIAVNKTFIICLATYSSAHFSEELIQYMSGCITFFFLLVAKNVAKMEPTMSIMNTPPTFFSPISCREALADSIKKAYFPSLSSTLSYHTLFINTLKNRCVAAFSTQPYLIVVWAANDLALSKGKGASSTVRKAAKLAVYEDTMISVKKAQTPPITRVDSAL